MENKSRKRRRIMKQKKGKKSSCIHPYGFNEIAKGYDIRAKFLPEKRCPKRYETGRVLIVTGPFVVHFRSSHCSCYSEEEPATRATSNPSDVPATRKLEIQCVFPPLPAPLPSQTIYIYIHTPPIFSFRVEEHEMVVGSLISNVCSPNFTDISRVGVEQRYLSGNGQSFSSERRVSF